MSWHFVQPAKDCALLSESDPVVQQRITITTLNALPCIVALRIAALRIGIAALLFFRGAMQPLPFSPIVDGLRVY
jgi:hypothetical protein